MQQRTPRIQDPIILALHSCQLVAAQAKSLTQQALRAIAFDSVTDGFARGRNPESMMRQIVAEHEGRQEASIVALACGVDALKFAGGA